MMTSKLSPEKVVCTGKWFVEHMKLYFNQKTEEITIEDNENIKNKDNEECVFTSDFNESAIISGQILTAMTNEKSIFNDTISEKKILNDPIHVQEENNFEKKSTKQKALHMLKWLELSKEQFSNTTTSEYIIQKK